MEIKIKQRLIGTVVILAVGAIFLPLLFYNPHPATSLSMVTTVPKAPDKPEVQLQLSQSSTIEETAPTEAITIPLESIVTESKKKSNPSTSHPVLGPVSTISSGSQAKSNVAATTSQTLVLSIQSQEFDVPGKPPKIKKKIVAKKPPSSANLLLSKTPKAWIIQVASFVNQNNAKRLFKKLQMSGFDIYIRQSNEGKIVHRIFIGPIIDYTKIIQIQKELKQKLHLNGVIERYQMV